MERKIRQDLGYFETEVVTMSCCDKSYVKMTNTNVMEWRSTRTEDILRLNCTSGRRGVPEWGDPGSLKQKEKLSFILKKARWMWLLLENAKQETRIIRIASVTITSPRIMMTGRKLSQGQDHFLGISQKPSRSLPRLFSPGFLLRVLSIVDLKDSPQSGVYARLQPRDLCGSYRMNQWGW